MNRTVKQRRDSKGRFLSKIKSELYAGALVNEEKRDMRGKFLAGNVPWNKGKKQTTATVKLK